MQIYFAPMQGVTDAPFRRIHAARFTGVAKYFTPFISPTQTDNLTNGAVTAAKVRADSRTQYLELPVPAEWSGTGPYTQTLAVEGLRETDRPKVHFRAPESFGELENQQDAFGQLYDVVSAQGAVTLYAKIRPAAAFAVTLEVTRI